MWPLLLLELPVWPPLLLELPVWPPLLLELPVWPPLLLELDPLLDPHLPWVHESEQHSE